MAFVGAFGTGEAPFWTRLAYWVSVMMLGAVAGWAMAALIAKLRPGPTNEWVFGTILAVAIAIPGTLLVWLYTSLFFRFGLEVASLPYFFGPVLVVSAAMTTLMMLTRAGAVTHAAPASAAPVTPRFFVRMPSKLKGGVLYAVQSEDHYLRLHTSKGSDLILMRLSDAITELDGVEGAQTHRSWWVAKDAVESAKRDGDRVTLVLKGGAEAPVSRPNIRPLREAGWF